MALWKHYVVLFGGFYDPGVASEHYHLTEVWFCSKVNSHIARYMNDLWVFDTQEYKWQQIEFKDPNERRPSSVAA